MVTVRTALVHLCPHRAEVDVGRIEMEFVGEAPELHGLSAYLQSFASVSETHEAITEAIQEQFPKAKISTFWHTAGCDVEVAA